MSVTSNADGRGAGFVSVGTADAFVGINATARVSIGTGATVTGWEGVDLIARFAHINDNVGDTAHSYARVERPLRPRQQRREQQHDAEHLGLRRPARDDHRRAARPERPGSHARRGLRPARALHRHAQRPGQHAPPRRLEQALARDRRRQRRGHPGGRRRPGHRLQLRREHPRRRLQADRGRVRHDHRRRTGSASTRARPAAAPTRPPASSPAPRSSSTTSATRSARRCCSRPPATRATASTGSAAAAARGTSATRSRRS